jgi:hypothetical protein
MRPSSMHVMTAVIHRPAASPAPLPTATAVLADDEGATKPSPGCTAIEVMAISNNLTIRLIGSRRARRGIWRRGTTTALARALRPD